MCLFLPLEICVVEGNNFDTFNSAHITKLMFLKSNLSHNYLFVSGIRGLCITYLFKIGDGLLTCLPLQLSYVCASEVPTVKGKIWKNDFNSFCKDSSIVIFTTAWTLEKHYSLRYEGPQLYVYSAVKRTIASASLLPQVPVKEKNSRVVSGVQFLALNPPNFLSIQPANKLQTLS